MDRACIGKAEDQPCNVTDGNQVSDCYEPVHAFKKIRTTTSGLRKSPNKWTKEENQKLAVLVSSYGEKKWKRISAEMGGQKTGAQCAQHWKRVLSPEIRKGHWDENEEDLLLRLVVQYGSCWKKIAKKIPQRTDIQCRYQYLKAKQSREVLWDTKEDESLLKKVMEMAHCNFYGQDHNVTTSSNSDNEKSTNIPLRDSSNYNTSPSSSASNSSYDKENDDSGASSSGSGSDTKEEINSKIKTSGERGKNAWLDDKYDANSDSSIDARGQSWRSDDPSSLSESCTNCHKPIGTHVNKVVWLDVSEHMARLKLTSTLRTALECKTRFTELLGNKISFSAPSKFCISNSSPENSGKQGLKRSGDFAGIGLGNLGSGGIDGRGFHTGLGDSIGIKINSTNNNKVTIPASSNGNNINLTNCNNNNITINITNSYTTANTNQNGINFQQIAQCNTSPSTASPVNSERSLPLTHLLPKTALPSILSPAPPFPPFAHLSFPHFPQPMSRKPANVSVSGLDSLAAVASILPRQIADYSF
jgi:hypothetical protein